MVQTVFDTKDTKGGSLLTLKSLRVLKSMSPVFEDVIFSHLRRQI